MCNAGQQLLQVAGDGWNFLILQSQLMINRRWSVGDSLVQCGVGVSFISSAARWRCPPRVTLLPVRDLHVTFPFALLWNKTNNSPLLAKLVGNVKSLVKERGRDNEILG